MKASRFIRRLIIALLTAFSTSALAADSSVFASQLVDSSPTSHSSINLRINRVRKQMQTADATRSHSTLALSDRADIQREVIKGNTWNNWSNYWSNWSNIPPMSSRNTALARPIQNPRILR